MKRAHSPIEISGKDNYYLLVLILANINERYAKFNNCEKKIFFPLYLFLSSGVQNRQN